MLARADFGIAALQAVEPHHFERLVLVIGGHGDRRRGALAGDLDHVAFGDAELGEYGLGHAGDAAAAFLLPGCGDLQPDGSFFDVATSLRPYAPGSNDLPNELID